MLRVPAGNAICYSGYRSGQSPDRGHYPSLGEIREDLRILRKHWRVLRLYDCTLHAERVLQVIRSDRLDFEVLLGAWLAAEVSNPRCPWGAVFSDEVLAGGSSTWPSVTTTSCSRLPWATKPPSNGPTTWCRSSG